VWPCPRQPRKRATFHDRLHSTADSDSRRWFHVKRLLLVATLVVFAGCAGIVPGDGGSDGQELAPGIGEVENVSYDDDLSVDASDGLSEDELDQFVKRSMARVEVVRERDFKRLIDTEIITREQYREEYGGNGGGDAAWQNQLWEGLFIIGEDRNASQVLDRTFSAAVQGFYDPGEERITIVSDEAEARVNKVTLVHELVHALQDQRFGLGHPTDTWDADYAHESVIEGEAALIPRLYLDNCEQWGGCLRPGEEATATSDADPGVLLVLRQPYEEGRSFVREVRADGGWDAVDGLNERPPNTTSEVIHPDRYPDFEPADVTVSDRSNSGWHRFDRDANWERLGEGAIYAMFAANGVIENDDPSSYSHPASAGWTGDRFVPYRNGDSFGYVWKTEWENADEAAEFQQAYEDLLDTQGALARGANSHRIGGGSFAGGYRVTRDGSTVTIVHGPSVGSLSDIYDP
jgi:hypothetical protein